jgi:IMP cyclohydrolase
MTGEASKPIRAIVMITYADNSSMLIDVKDPRIAEISDVLIEAQSTNFTGVINAREGHDILVRIRPSREEPYFVSTYPTKSQEA